MVDLSILEFPVSLVLALAFVTFIILCRKTPIASFFNSRLLSTVLIVAVSVLIAIEGTWGIGLFRHWAFVAIVLLILTALCFVSISDWTRKSYTSLLSHLGLALVLFGGLFGAPDCTDVQMRVFADGYPEHMAYDASGNVLPLPFSVSLEDFTIDYYGDGTSPKQYTSTLSIDGKEFRTAVNKPCRYKGYSFYQSGFDPDSHSYSVIKLVRDPWLPILALGALMLALSALLSLKTTWKSWTILVAAMVLAAVFAVISVARINFGTLAPALRSLWFIPHLIIYMLAYAIMALSVVTGIISLFSDKVPVQLSRRLLSTASTLLLLGMLCGAVWAKQAWGQYWTWDSKECWAAVTWLLTLAGTHAQGRKQTMIFTVLAFLAIQMTWYGVNYLPASSQSLHTYNQTTTI